MQNMKAVFDLFSCQVNRKNEIYIIAALAHTEPYILHHLAFGFDFSPLLKTKLYLIYSF